MVTGARAFEGDTSMSTLAAIIHQPARPVSHVNAAVPRELERLISRCHRKDPAKRVQSMGDLRVALEELRDDLESGRLSGPVPAAAVAPRSGWRRSAAFAAAALGVLAAGAAGGYALKPPSSAAAPALSIRHFTADVGVTDDPAVTSNGSLIAYASDRFDGTNRDIWVQPASGGDPVRVTTDAADDGEPAFSPDGGRIAFRSERDGGGIYIVPALGGSERLLVRDGRHPAFSPDGKWIVYVTGGRGTIASLFVMPAAGGAPRRLFADSAIGGRPVWAPDSARVMVVASKDGLTDAFIVAIDDKAPAAPRATGVFGVLPEAMTPVLEAWTGERLLCSSEAGSGGIWSVNVRDGRAGGAVPVYQSASPIGRVAIDAAGRMYFADVSTRTSLWSIPEGMRAAGAAPVAITVTAAADDMPSLSADGRSLAFRSTRRMDASVWVRDMGTRRETAVPSPAQIIGAALSPDGRTVAYTSSSAGPDTTELTIVGASGGVPRTVCQKCAGQIWTWTSDGRALLVAAQRPNVLSLVDVATGRVERLIEGHDNEIWLARNSPDGQWLSFIRWPVADRARIYVAPFKRGAPIADASWIPVTSGETVDEEQAWAPDGRTIYFVSERDGFRCIYAAPFDPSACRVGAVQPILHGHGTGRRLLPTAAAPGRLDAGGGRLVFPMQETQSNIHAITIEKAPR
jgi:Tol biopolymer transport system component